MEGQVDMTTKDEEKFMHLPPGSIFNDYTLLFDLKSNIGFKAYQPVFTSLKQEQSTDDNLTVTMNIEADKFNELKELYPETCENLKLRSLEKRSIFMYYKNKVIQRKKQNKMARMKVDQTETMYQKEAKRDKEIYESTYKGTEVDSDKDEFHITMPFNHSDEIHRKILEEPEFESDESFNLEQEEMDQANVDILDKNNEILSTMQKTI